MGGRERKMDVLAHAPPLRPPPPPPPSPPPPSMAGIPPESRIQRYKLIWRVFMIANLGLGAYIFAKAKMKESSVKSENPPVKDPPPTPSTSETSTSSAVDFFDEPDYLPSTPIADLVKVHEPIAEDQQREIFQWILDEKRKMKPTNKDEKKRIDDDKAILKKFIRSELIPPV